MRLENLIAKQLRWCGLLVLLALVTVAGAQQQKSPPAKAGVVSGSVFLITKGGDLKPARMADVYLLYVYRSAKAASAGQDYMGSAAHAWVENHIKASEEYRTELAQDGVNWSDSLQCRKHLLTYTVALSATLAWADESQKIWQILTTEADENGVFKIAVSHPGKYTVLASGHAGLNDAFWRVDDVVVNPGATTTVKLSSPAEACLGD